MEGDRPPPQAIFETLTAYQKSAALAGAIELDLFTAIGEGAASVTALAERLQASRRGVRSLCDYLVVHGLLVKSDEGYGLSEAAALYLDRRSEHYMGSAAEFLHAGALRLAFEDVARAVRKGGTVLEGGGLMAPEHPAWGMFARAVAPLAARNAGIAADRIASSGPPAGRLLDIAAGHGHYGIALARRWPEAHLVIQDWGSVLQVAADNARAAGLEGRFSLLPGDAFVVEPGGPYDLVLLTNFLHHFDRAHGLTLMRRLRAALAPGGRVAVLESLVNADRVTPPHAAGFSLVMLVTTPSGDAFTREEIEGLFGEVGLSLRDSCPLPESPQSLLVFGS